MSLSIPFPFGWLLNKNVARGVEVNVSLAFLYWVWIALHPWPFVSDIAIFVLKGDVKLQLTVTHSLLTYGGRKWRPNLTLFCSVFCYGCMFAFVIHAGCVAAGVVLHSVASVCLSVHTLTGNWLELSTPNFVHIYSIAVARHTLTRRSKVKVTRLRKLSRWRGC